MPDKLREVPLTIRSVTAFVIFITSYPAVQKVINGQLSHRSVWTIFTLRRTDDASSNESV